jgi:hypothetical protein
LWSAAAPILNTIGLPSGLLLVGYFDEDDFVFAGREICGAAKQKAHLLSIGESRKQAVSNNSVTPAGNLLWCELLFYRRFCWDVSAMRRWRSASCPTG